MNDTEFEKRFDGYISAVEEYLSKCLTRNDKVEEAMEFTLSAGGKRIRPVLSLAVCDMLCGKPEKAIDCACAVELIHTYSLIHDDLPCMDDSDTRRGKPSNHVAYGETLALLAGDGLLTKAFFFAARSGMPKAISVISENAYAMVIGQADEFVNMGKDVSVDDIMGGYARKTSALLIAAAVCGGIAAGADDETLALIKDFAFNLGLAFQVIDDLLDAGSEDCALIDKLGIDGAEKLAAELSEKAVFAISAFKNNEFLIKLTEKLLHRNR